MEQCESKLGETSEEVATVAETGLKDTTPLLGHHENKSVRNNVIGGILAFLSSLLFTASSVIIQQLSINYSDAIVVRYSLQVITLLTIITWTIIREKSDSMKTDTITGKHSQNSFGLLIFQGFCNGICVLGEFMCVSLMPIGIGDATAIIFSSPLPSMILSTLFLGHSLRLYKIGCGAMLFLGVLLVVKPPFLFKEFKDFSSR